MHQAPGGDFDLASATAIPQYDRFGRGEFLEILARAQVQIPCDVTESADVPWRRWFCNLGRHSGAVIGHGIRCVRLEALEAEEAAPGGARRIGSATFHAETVDKCKWHACIYRCLQWVDGTQQRRSGHSIERSDG